LETLDLARIHARALATLEAASRDGVINPSEIFFNEAIRPMEKTHRAALRTNAHLRQVHKTLDRRTLHLTAANRSLKRSIARRKSAEQALKKSAEHFRKLLAESRRTQNHLRHMTHQVLSAQENKRKKISHELHDEIAQTLLGINVRLVTLKEEAAGNARGFKEDIGSTQRLVQESVQFIHRFARELEAPQPGVK
jgi:signal transduction histidine kinase